MDGKGEKPRKDVTEEDSGDHMLLACLHPKNTTYKAISTGLCPRSLYLLTLENPIRRVAVQIIKSKLFDNIVLLLILANCVFLAMDSNEPNFSAADVLKVAEIFFTVAFSIEMVLKIVGMGCFVGKNTYLRDSWNCMDCTVVVLGLLAFLPKGVLPSVSAIRTVRVLRPLRTVTGVEGMRVLVVTLLQSLPMLMDVTVLVSFAFFIFGIIGVQMFSERMRNRCHVPIAPEGLYPFEEAEGFWPIDSNGSYLAPNEEEVTWWLSGDEEEVLCSGPMGGRFPAHPSPDIGAGRGCGDYFHTLDDGTEVAIPMWCVRYENPNFGITNFDQILYAFLTIFQCISLEGWTDVMYHVQDGVSNWVWVYFTIMIVFGSFFAVNLALAVLYVKFTEEGDNKDEEEEDAKKEGESSENAVTPENYEGGGIVGFCYRLQAKNWFDWLTMGLIILNTVIMSTEYYGMPDAQSEAYEYVNYVLTAYFAIEMFIKLIGLGVRGYCADSFNVFDCAVVILSFVEIIVNAASGGGGGGFLSVLRSFRLLRVFKLARSWKQLNQIITTIFKSFASVSYLCLILLLFIFIFALLGKQLFGYQFQFCDGYPEGSQSICPPGESSRCPKHYDCYVACDAEEEDTWVDASYGLCVRYPVTDPLERHNLDEPKYLVRVGESYVPRHNFDDIFWSIVTIFQTLTGENWNEVMYDGMRATSSIAALYFIALTIVGNYIILNLFLAILLDNFGGGGDDDEEEEENEDEKTEQNAAAEQPPPSQPSINSFMDGDGKDADGKDSARLESLPPGGTNFTAKSLHLNAFPTAALPKEKAPVTAKTPLNGNSLFVLAPDNGIRLYLANIVCHKYFEYTIIVLICISSLILAIDSPSLDEDGDLKKALNEIDKVFVVLFSIEMILKIVVLGFALHPGSYIRNAWNVLDFFIVIIGIIGWIGIGGDNLSALRALRTFRALRPIRMASRAEGMKVVVNALFHSIPGIANVFFVCLLFYLIFGILGLNLFKGAFHYCEVTGGDVDDLVGEKLPFKWLYDLWLAPGQDDPLTWDPPKITKDWCQSNSSYHLIEYPSPSLRPPVTVVTKWTNPENYDFDNIGSSILTLFEMATLEGWLEVMYAGIDATEDELQPQRDYNRAMVSYFLMFVVVGSFFVMNLFVGVTIDKFNEMKEKQEGRSVFLTPEQRNWVSIQKLMVNIKLTGSYVQPTGEFRRAVFQFVINDNFDAFIMAMILLNVLFMSMAHADMSTEWEDALKIINYIFATIFAAEAVLKLIALYPSLYFRDRMNCFDFVVVILSIVAIVITQLFGTGLPGLSLLRILRVARIFRLIPKAKGLRTLFQTLLISLPALGNVGSVLMLFFCIFAIMGMNLFGKIKPADSINRHANFHDFPSALMVLFRMSTGEYWNGIMHDCMISTECWLVTKQEHPYFGQYFSDGDDQLREWVVADSSIPSGPDFDVPNGSWGDKLSLSSNDGMENQCAPDPYGIAAIVYFCVFVILCAFVMLNLVIAVILENFQTSTENEDAPVGAENMQSFQDVWSKLDPLSTYYIPASKLQYIIQELEPPLGIRGTASSTKTDIQSIIMSVDIPNHNGMIHFYETLHALSGRIAGIDLPEEEEVKIRVKIKDRLPTFVDDEDLPKYTAAHYHAALYVQAAVRGFLARYHMRNRPEGGEGQGGRITPTDT